MLLTNLICPSRQKKKHIKSQSNNFKNKIHDYFLLKEIMELRARGKTNNNVISLCGQPFHVENLKF